MQKEEHEQESQGREEMGKCGYLHAHSNMFSCDVLPCLLACEIINDSDTS